MQYKWLIISAIISPLFLVRSDGQVPQRQNQGLSNPVWNNVVDVASSLDPNYATPLFWHIHKAGGTSLHDFLSSCLNLTLAAEVGVLGGHELDQHLAVVENNGRLYVNVDTTTNEGIQRAHALGFQNTPHIANVVISPLIIPATGYLFARDNKAAVFALLRHPVDRAISQFFYLQGATWEPTYSEKWASMTLMDYIKSEWVEGDWMVRFLVDKPTGLVDEHDLEDAKNILRQKCWLGLQSRMSESVTRFGALFGWNQHPRWTQCMDLYQEGAKRSNGNTHKKTVTHDGEEWTLLSQLNSLDMKLFAYAKQLFDEQSRMYVSQPIADIPT